MWRRCVSKCISRPTYWRPEPARHGQIHGLAVGREADHTLVKRAVEFSLRRFGTLPVSLFVFGGEEDIRTFHARYLRLVGTARLLVARGEIKGIESLVKKHRREIGAA